MVLSGRRARALAITLAFFAGMAVGTGVVAGAAFLRFRALVASVPREAPRSGTVEKAVTLIEKTAVRSYGLDDRQRAALHASVTAHLPQVLAARDASRSTFLAIAQDIYRDMAPSLSETQRSLAASRLNLKE